MRKHIYTATPTISFPGNIFPGQDVLIVGTYYYFLPAVVTVPGITDTTILPQIRYKTNDANIATIKPVVTLEGARIKITILKPSTVPIQIIAYTEATNNFTAARTVYSKQRSSYSNVPLISAPSINGISSTNTLTYGQIPIPTFEKAVLQNPRPNTFFHSSISIEHISSDTKVATIDGTTIKLHKYGTFKIIAKAVATGVAIGVFKKNRIDSPLITVNRATPTFNASWNPIPRVMFIDDVATITPPEFTFPAAPVPAEILPITYSYTTAGIIKITPAIQPMPPTPPLTTSVRINNIGKFKIKATTEKSDRYESTYFYSPKETTTIPRIPVIEFPPPPPAPPTTPPTTPTFITQVTFGTPYTLREAFFRIPADTRDPATNGVTINYSIENPNPSNVATASGTRGETITITAAGTFHIKARTTTTGVLFDNAVPIPSPRVTVNRATPTFQTTPWNAFPTNTANVPIGTRLTITPPEITFPLQTTFPSTLLQQQNTISIEYDVGNADISGLIVTPRRLGTFTIIARTVLNNNYNVASITSSHTITVFNPIPPRIVIHNVETLVFQEASIPQSPDFIQESPRGFPEWFAVVDQRSFTDIRNYAITRAQGALGTAVFMRIPGDNSTLIPFNNIVTTLMTNMASLFNGITNFNEVIASWDTSRVTSMNSMFNDCTNFNQRIERWNTGQVQDMNAMFARATRFSQNLGFWNTERVRYMFSMFNNATAFNNGGFQGFGNWNVSNVLDMQSMFSDATSFNMPISWDTREVRNMGNMFFRASRFNESLSLDTRNVTNMGNMFNGATEFLGLWGNVALWNTSSVRNMNSMFQNSAIACDIQRWDTSQVTDMNNMFQNARNFNRPIGRWNTSNVVIMSNMFGQAISFNQPIGRWNTSRVTNMSQMFDGATIFNQPINTNGSEIGAWNTSSVTNMSWMFRDARNFNQNIGGWNTSRVTDMQHMFEGATSFNNGHWPPIFGFDGFFSQQEFLDITVVNGSNPRITRTPNPRQTMNWNLTQVANFNFMFHNASSFFNVDISRWFVARGIGFGNTRSFRGGSCPLSDIFTPWDIWFFAPNRGR